MPNEMSKSDSSRIQSSQVRFRRGIHDTLTDLSWQAKAGGDMSSGGFSARAQGAGDRNANAGGNNNNNAGGGTGGNTGGFGAGNQQSNNAGSRK
jgi:hypothetical protein